MKGGFLGPNFTDDEIQSNLLKLNAVFKKYKFDELVNITAKYISEGKQLVGFKVEWNLARVRLAHDQF